MACTSTRHGYTLRDLLVVILIICVLLALTVPFIQASREAAQRTQCSNNLKNIILSLQGYHGPYGVFPMGAMHVGPRMDEDSPNDSRLGPSWWYGILPYMEQRDVYIAISATQQSGRPGGNEFCARDMIAAGVASRDVDGTLIAPFAQFEPYCMRCPSSPLPVFESPTGPICLPSYVGITGGCDIDPRSQAYVATNPDLRPTSPEGIVYQDTAKGVAATPGGIITANGMLPPGEHVQMSQCTDGISHTIIVAEQSDWLRDRTPTSSRRYHGDAGWTAGGTAGGGGWLSGTRRCDPIPIIAEPGGPPAPWGADCWNLTTVRYPANYKAVLGASPMPGCSENHGINNPIQSAHPGGVHVAFVDGSVHFITESTDLTRLLRCAIRRDGISWRAIGLMKELNSQRENTDRQSDEP